MAAIAKRSDIPRRVLQGNAIFSAATGLTLLVGSGPVATFLGWDAPLVLTGSGIGLLGFAALVFAFSRQPDPRKLLLIAELDALWVLGSVILLVGGWLPFTLAGKWAFAAIAEIVGTLAALEFYAVWRMRRGA